MTALIRSAPAGGVSLSFSAGLPEKDSGRPVDEQGRRGLMMGRPRSRTGRADDDGVLVT
jgi:hypothetical protein